MGAMLGGVIGYADMAALDHHGHELGAFALVGMGAVFAGVVRAPITSVLIIFEMTGGYGLVLPLMIANMTAYGLARRLRPTGIYDALLEQDGVRLPRSGLDDPMHEVKVRLLVETISPIPPALPLSEVMKQLLASRAAALPCGPDQAGAYGLVLLDEARALREEHDLDRVIVAADLTRPIPSVEIDSQLGTALQLMDARGVDAVPVFDPVLERAIGVITRADIGRFLFHQFARRQKETNRG
jgi:CIC family chloride channel protein